MSKVRMPGSVSHENPQPQQAAITKTHTVKNEVNELKYSTIY